MVKVNQMVLNVNDILVMAVLKPSHVHHLGHAGFQILDVVADVSFDFPSTLIVELVVDFLVDADDCTLQINRFLDKKR